MEKGNLKKDRITHAWGIASCILGSISIILFLMPYFGIVLAILAVVFSGKQKKIEPTGMATAGLVTGIIGIVINAVALLFVVIVLIFIGGFKGLTVY